MATVVMLKHEQSGIIKKGFFGFSWTMLFFGGFVPVFRGEWGLGIAMLALNFVFGIGLILAVIFAFFYNKRYTLKLIEQGYRLADSEGLNALAKSKLGIA